MSKPRVLFVCEGNRARSQVAEALLRFHAGDRFDVHSAGIRPGVGLPDFTARTLDEIGVPYDGQHGKHFSEFEGETFDWVITVCDYVRDEDPPLPYGERLHWSVEDPGDMQVRGLSIDEAMREVRSDLQARIAQFIARPDL